MRNCSPNMRNVFNANSDRNLKLDGNIVSYYSQLFARQYSKQVQAVVPYYSAFSFSPQWTGAALPNVYNDLTSGNTTIGLPTFDNTKIFYAGKLDFAIQYIGAINVGVGGYNLKIDIVNPYRTNVGASALVQNTIFSTSDTSGSIQTAVPIGVPVFNSQVRPQITSGQFPFNNDLPPWIFSGFLASGVGNATLAFPLLALPVFQGYQILTD